MSSYGILSTANFAVKLPLYMVCAFGVILAVAFIVGFVKGVRKVAWGGFYWLVAGAGFVFANLYMNKMNPFTKMLKGNFASMAGCLWTLTLALGCILISLIFYGLFSALLRPREVYAKKQAEGVYDFEVEDDEEDDTPYAEEASIIIKGGGKPKFFGRLGGAFMCVVNIAAVLATITAVLLFVIEFTPLRKGAMGEIFRAPLARIALKYATAYAFDFFAIGLIFWIAYKGFHTGFLKVIYALTSTFGILIVVVVCFAIPFIKLGDMGIFGVLKDRLAPLFVKIIDPVEGILLKISMGAILAVVCAIAMMLINAILKVLSKAVKAWGFFRVIDGFFSLLLYLAIGVLVVAVIWSAVYTADYCGILGANDAIMEKSVLAKNFFDGAGAFLEKLADKTILFAKA